MSRDTGESTSLNYLDSEGIPQEVKACRMTKDAAGRFWLWSEYLEHNLSYKAKSREDCLLSAISSLLFTIKLRDERIAGLQRIADLATAFADQIKPDEEPL